MGFVYEWDKPHKYEGAGGDAPCCFGWEPPDAGMCRAGEFAKVHAIPSVPERNKIEAQNDAMIVRLLQDKRVPKYEGEKHSSIYRDEHMTHTVRFGGYELAFRFLTEPGWMTGDIGWHVRIGVLQSHLHFPLGMAEVRDFLRNC